MILIGYASMYLLSSSCNFNSSTLQVLELGLGVLERSQWWAPRATSAQVPLVQVQVPKSNSASPRWTWGLGLGLGGLERSRPSPPPPAVGLIPKSSLVQTSSRKYMFTKFLTVMCCSGQGGIKVFDSIP